MSTEQASFERAVSLVEALIFANAEPVKPKKLVDMLSAQGLEAMVEQLEEVVAAVEQRYEGHAVELCAVAGGWQLRTRESVAPALAKTVEKPRRLSRSAMEALAVVVYHQPCTRVEIETIRGVTLGQNILDRLLEEGLIAPKGRKAVPGRPVLWGTTPMFLRVFGLDTLSDLPRREELVVEPSSDDDSVHGRTETAS